MSRPAAYIVPSTMQNNVVTEPMQPVGKGKELMVTRKAEDVEYEVKIVLSLQKEERNGEGKLRASEERESEVREW